MGVESLRRRKPLLLISCAGLGLFAVAVLILQLCNSAFSRSNPTRQLGRGEIEWISCESFGKQYGKEFECGKLYAPLDYTNLEYSRNANITVIRFKAGQGRTPRSEVLGSVLTNPGGPGVSGLEFLSRQTGNVSVARSLDTQLESKFDLISFDPRGVGETWPRVQCFDDPHKFLYYDVVTSIYGYPGQHGRESMDHEIGALLAESKLIGDVCSNHRDAELFKYMSTPFVARDMRLLHEALGDTKLNYWGFSYGTALGLTYADMFPDDVNRIALDGVLDMTKWYKGTFSDHYKDIEEEFNAFFEECHRSGPSKCKLSELAPSASELKQLVLGYAEQLKIDPLPVATADPPRLLTYFDLIVRLYVSMYRPVSWRQLADDLYAALGTGDARTMLLPLDLHPSIKMESEALQAIACGDSHTPPAKADGSSMWDIERYKEHVSSILEDTPLFAHFSGRIAPVCDGAWRARAVERHWGNFTSETSFPILALGNDLDPVTPGRFVDKVAGLFPHAVSVRREGYGHCSDSQPSKCMREVIADYFVRGVLPHEGLKCPVDIAPFEDWEKISVDMLPAIV